MSHIRMSKGKSYGGINMQIFKEKKGKKKPLVRRVYDVGKRADMLQ